MNRIPVNVNVNTETSSSPNQQKFSTTSEFRSSSSNANKATETTTKTSSSNLAGGGGGGNTYNMRNINDETDRIRERMREFEEHCRRVREQAFANRPPFPSTGGVGAVGSSSPPGPSTGTSFFTNEFDQRVPSSFDSPGSRLGSSMHRSTVEDQPDGTKKYRIEFDIGDFEQNELYIGTNGKTLVVKGDREIKAGAATETKTFNRELTLPDYVDVGRMNAFLLNNASPVAATSTTAANSQFRSSQTQLVSQSTINNVLVVEAPIIMEKYSYRRSAFDQSNKSQSPIRTSNISSQQASPRGGGSGFGTSFGTGGFGTSGGGGGFGASSNTRLNGFGSNNGGLGGANSSSSVHESAQQRHENRSSSSTTTTHHKVVRSTSGNNLMGDEYGGSTYRSSGAPIYTSQSNLHNQSLSPELIPGYPLYDANESCVVYKFDLTGFDQSEIHLTITNDRVLEIRACKELRDELGKIYKEFKREIHLEPEVDDKLIKNVLHDGILTLKIPKPNRPDGLGSLSNSHNLASPNGFREVYGDDGRLQKLTADFRGFAPENVRIVLSANNVLKVSAQQSEQSPTHKGGTVQKECTRHYTLPAWVQPENMKAIMSRDGVLTVDFNSASSSSAASASTNPAAASTSSATAAANSNNKGGDRINISN